MNILKRIKNAFKPELVEITYIERIYQEIPDYADALKSTVVISRGDLSFSIASLSASNAKIITIRNI